MKYYSVVLSVLLLPLLLLNLVVTLHAQAAGGGHPLFLDNFADPSSSSKNWEQTTNGGTLLFAKGSVFLKGVGGGYPVIKTRQDPFPVSGEWTASFGYRFTSIGHYGNDLSCQGPNGEIIADVHQDVNGQLVQVNDNLSSTKPDTDWHVVAFVMTDNHIAAYLDGKLTGEHQISLRPTKLAVGGGSIPNPWDWNDLEIRFMRVDAGKNVLNKAALSLNGMSDTDPSVSSAPSMNNIATTKVPVPRQAGDVKYKIANLGAFPIALHTNWFLDIEITNDTNATITAVGTQLDLLFNDSTKLPLIIYDPDKSYIEGTFFITHAPSLDTEDIKAHSKKVFHAYFFDSALISPNYYGQAHQAGSVIVTADGKQTATLPVNGF